LLFDAAGRLYGTTYYDGAYNLGSVYELFPQQVGEWKERVLYSFQGGSDGQNSISNLVFGAAGNLYGTTSEGGLGSGVIFKLTPMANARWSESVPHRFQGPPDAAFAYNGMGLMHRETSTGQLSMAGLMEKGLSISSGRAKNPETTHQGFHEPRDSGSNSCCEL
jgi:uncharacterized repeat protein (TIGR03803 family)